MTARVIRLTSEDLHHLERPVSGEGGFQSLMRRLKESVAGADLVVDDDMIEQMRRYAGKYGSGGSIRSRPWRDGRPRFDRCWSRTTAAWVGRPRSGWGA
jgi:hypothetical protein